MVSARAEQGWASTGQRSASIDVLSWGPFVGNVEMRRGRQFKPLPASHTLVPPLMGEELWPPEALTQSSIAFPQQAQTSAPSASDGRSEAGRSPGTWPLGAGRGGGPSLRAVGAALQ